MDIQFKINNKKQGSFFIMQDERQIAELDFEIKENLLNAYHTGVRPEFEGQGIAGRLFEKLVDYAGEEGLKIIPSCSYILAKFKRNPDRYKEIWHRGDEEPTGEFCGIKPKK